MGQLLLEGAWGAAQHIHHQIGGQLPQHLQPHSVRISKYIKKGLCYRRTCAMCAIGVRWHKQPSTSGRLKHPNQRMMCLTKKR